MFLIFTVNYKLALIIYVGWLIRSDRDLVFQSRILFCSLVRYMWELLCYDHQVLYSFKKKLFLHLFSTVLWLASYHNLMEAFLDLFFTFFLPVYFYVKKDVKFLGFISYSH